MSIKDKILYLLVERDLNRRVELFLDLLNNYSSFQINDVLKDLNVKDLEQIKKINDIKLKFIILKTLCDGDDKETAKKSMELMKKHIDDCLRIDNIEDKIFILKYIAIHSDKKTFRKAVKMLGALIKDISKIENMELQASTLRYLVIHSNEKIRKKALLQLEKIPDKGIRRTSLEYVEKMQKYD
jgi:hypothetical protein